MTSRNNRRLTGAFVGLLLGGAAAFLWLRGQEDASPSTTADEVMRSGHEHPSVGQMPARDPSAQLDRLLVEEREEPVDRRMQAGRPPSEWQGMPQNPDLTWPCEEADQCGLARACIDGSCRACTSDGDCASAEGCVLDHCVDIESIACRLAEDCDPDELCVLSGYSATPRGNDGMNSFCRPSTGGSESGVEDPAPGPMVGPRPSEEDDWRERAIRQLEDQDEP